jgi:hypothetical protein
LASGVCTFCASQDVVVNRTAGAARLPMARQILPLGHTSLRRRPYVSPRGDTGRLHLSNG